MTDTIAAVATPPGAGGLGVIRVSGPAALAVAGAVFRAKAPLDQAASHTLHHGLLADAAGPVDDAVAAVFRAPRSYTGEDVVELSCHGGPAILRRALAACLANGARAAGPGEFTQRAFLNGKMDLAQAEAVAALIAARSEQARRWALDQLRGGLSARVEELRRRVLELLARLEAGFDFVEDEVPDLARRELAEGAAAIARDVAALAATAPRGRLFREGLRTVLAGRPNAGKSSLFNALLDADRAIVADLPGTTRDTLEESIDVDGVPVVLTDTAGLREDAGAVEAQGIARARAALARADAALWLMDASSPLCPEDLEAARALAGRPAVAVFNKMDLADPGLDRIALAEAARRAAPGVRETVFVSARAGTGLDELRRALLRAAAPGDAAEAEDGPTLFLDRHADLIRAAGAALAAALRGAQEGAPDECVAADLRRALEDLGRVTGRGVPDEVLDAVFSRFCVGK